MLRERVWCDISSEVGREHKAWLLTSPGEEAFAHLESELQEQQGPLETSQQRTMVGQSCSVWIKRGKNRPKRHLPLWPHFPWLLVDEVLCLPIQQDGWDVGYMDSVSEIIRRAVTEQILHVHCELSYTQHLP